MTQLLREKGGQTRVSELEEMMPISPEIRKKLFVDGWKELVEKEDILKELQLGLEKNILYSQPLVIPEPHASSSNVSSSSSLSTSPPDSKTAIWGTDEDLREFYRMNWKKTQCDFCLKYSINQGCFSCWLRGKRNSPTARNAVYRFFKEHEEGGKKEK
jgi:hypothetical protein